MEDDIGQVTVAKVVQRAVALVDPAGTDEACSQLLMAFEDDDRPALGLGDPLAEELRTTVEGLDPEHDSAAAEVAAAVAAFLAGDPAGGHDRETTIREAVRIAWGGTPPGEVEAWLAAQGVEA
ncbi:MAG: hypothetical protein M3340_03145 [Actinomycetota bacterium]|nr:hypothetical protein [Actinomycetota bacterium]